MDNCIFCKIVSGAIPCTKIFENDHVLAFLDIAPLADGHTLVIPKAHFATMFDMPAELAGKLGETLPKLAQAICKATNTTACNIFQNNGRPAGQLVDHLHFHIVPRTPGDGIIRLGEQSPYPAGRMDKVAQAIISNL